MKYMLSAQHLCREFAYFTKFKALTWLECYACRNFCTFGLVFLIDFYARSNLQCDIPEDLNFLAVNFLHGWL